MRQYIIGNAWALATTFPDTSLHARAFSMADYIAGLHIKRTAALPVSRAPAYTIFTDVAGAIAER